MITHVISDRTVERSGARVSRQPAENIFSRAFVWSYRALMRARSRRAMLYLSDALLKDVGLSRADVEREMMKPFWR